MGTSRIVPVLVTFTEITKDGPRQSTPMEWRTKSATNRPGYGKPTAENLKAFVERFEASTKPGGCNDHLGLSIVTSAKIVRQATKEVLATYTGPSFVVF
jgi:hypothetical protein